MSSGPKRRGCDVCRKRHVKCDRQIPSCSQCIKAGWTCPGYASDFSFVNYSQEFPTGRARGTSEDAAGSSQRSESSDRQRLEGSRGRLPLSRIRPKPSPSSSRRPTSPPSPADSLREKFSLAIDSETAAVSWESVGFKGYLRRFVPLIGTHEAMDNAVRLISLASVLPPGERDATNTTNSALINAHSAAISSLRKSIADVNDAKTTGTLAAAILLHMYEQHCDPTSDVRNFHAHGYARIIQLRGPESFRDDTDLAILEGTAVNIVFVALREGEECFLAEPGWRDVFVQMAQLAPSSPGRMTPDQLDLTHTLCCTPGVIAAFHQWVDHQVVLAGGTRMRDSISPPPLTRSSPDNPSLTDYLITHRRRLRAAWIKRLPISDDEDEGPWSSHYDFIIHMTLSALLGLTDYMLATVAPDAATMEPDLRCPGGQRGVDLVDLGSRPYDLSSDFVAECKHLAVIVRKYSSSIPSHLVFCDRPGQLSFKFMWEKTKEHQFGVISGASAEIAELLDWAFAGTATAPS